MTKPFGPYLRAARKKAKLSLRTVADQAGISFTYLSKIETGVMPPPSEETVRKLAEIVGLETLMAMYRAGIVPAYVRTGLLANESLYREVCMRTMPPEQRQDIYAQMMAALWGDLYGEPKGGGHA